MGVFSGTAQSPLFRRGEGRLGEAPQIRGFGPSVRAQSARASTLGRLFRNLSRDSLPIQRIAFSGRVQATDGMVDGTVEAVEIGEGLMR